MEPRDVGGESIDPAAEKLRQRIAREAARLVGDGQDVHRARLRAARRVAGRFVPEADLPDHDSILRETGLRETGLSLRKPGFTLREAEPTLGKTGHPDTADVGAGSTGGRPGDRFDRIATLVCVLARVRQDPLKHPEGDLLEHSLQVFDRVERERPYDEELLTAALLHDVGKAVDRRDPVAAGLKVVGDLVTDRTRWFIEQLPAARQFHEGTLGARARKRLEASDDFEDLLVLEEADRKGRVRGYDSPSLEACVAALRRLAAE